MEFNMLRAHRVFKAILGGATAVSVAKTEGVSGTMIAHIFCRFSGEHWRFARDTNQPSMLFNGWTVYRRTPRQFKDLDAQQIAQLQSEADIFMADYIARKQAIAVAAGDAVD
jgi:hypothetical protein